MTTPLLRRVQSGRMESGKSEIQMALEDARILYQDEINPIPDEMPLLNHVVKIDKCPPSGAFAKWANDNIGKGLVPLTPFDKEGQAASKDIIECRSKELNPCSIDPACTARWSDATLFVSEWAQWLKRAQVWAEGNVDITKELGLNYGTDDLCVVVLYIQDRNNIRLPCDKVSSVDCPMKCNYEHYKENFPIDLCSTKTQADLPALSNYIRNMKLCESTGMPFQANGATPNGMTELIIVCGPYNMCEVKLVIPLQEFLQIIRGNHQFNPFDFRIFNQGVEDRIVAGGGNKIRKYKKRKTKKKRFKKIRSRRVRSKRRVQSKRRIHSKKSYRRSHKYSRKIYRKNKKKQ